MAGPWLSSWGPLLVLTLALAVLQSVYVAFGVAPSAALTAIASYALAFFVIMWVLTDARRRRRVPCFDFGLFVALGFPISVVWYLLGTRRRRGLAVLAVFVGLYLAPGFCAAAFSLALMVFAQPH